MRPPRTDWFSFFLGVFIAFPVVGIGTVFFRFTIIDSLVVGVGIVVVIAISVAEYIPDLPYSLARSWMHSVVIAVPTVAILVFALLLSSGIVPIRPTEIPIGLLVLAGSGVAGLSMHIAADNRLVSRVRSSESILIEWNATFSDSYVRRLRIIYIAIGGVLFVYGFALTVINQANGVGSFLMVPGGTIIMQTYILDRSKDATAFESGLAIHRPGTLHTAFIPWNQFTGYEHTDDELIIHRRLPLTSIHCDPTAIEDIDAVDETLHDMI